MQLEKLTFKAQEVIGKAQSLAMENQNSEIASPHVVKSLMEEDGGLVPNILEQAGMDLVPKGTVHLLGQSCRQTGQKQTSHCF